MATSRLVKEKVPVRKHTRAVLKKPENVKNKKNVVKSSSKSKRGAPKRDSKGRFTKKK